jgi:hypothetical protein
MADSKEAEFYERSSRWLLSTFAVLAVAGAVAHATVLPALDWVSLAFLFGGAIIVLLRNATKINLSKEGIAVDLVQQKALASVPSLGVGGKAGVMPTSEPTAEREINIENPDDPQKGKWGGQEVQGGFRLAAEVKPLETTHELFAVRLFVVSVQKGRELKSNVTFHLHPTFKNPIQMVQPRNGIAELSVVAWGAFTVGAVVADGDISLELDLSNVADAPQTFRQR